MDTNTAKQYYAIDLISDLHEYVDPKSDEFWVLKSKLTTVFALLSDVLPPRKVGHKLT